MTSWFYEGLTRLDHKEDGYEALSVPQACGFPRVVTDPPFRYSSRWMAQMNSGLEAARMDTMKGYSSGRFLERWMDSWMNIMIANSRELQRELQTEDRLVDWN